MTELIQPRVKIAVAAALDKKATDLDVLEVGKLTSIADYFIIMSAGNERQAQAISDNIAARLKEELGVRPLLIEGTTPGRWILLDPESGASATQEFELAPDGLRTAPPRRHPGEPPRA